MTIHFDQFNDKALNQENIFKMVSEFDVYSHYSGRRIKINSCFNSPLRVDMNPSFGIFERNNRLVFNDFSNGQAGDCVKFVQLKYNLSYPAALAKINRDFGLGLVYSHHNQSKSVKSHVIASKDEWENNYSLSVKTGEFTQNDYDYWTKKYMVRLETLKANDVYRIDKIMAKDLRKGVTKIYYYKDSNPIYGYKHKTGWKIYRPYNKSGKWQSYYNPVEIWGIDRLPDFGSVLIITKSAKDCLTLSEMEYPSIAPFNEAVVIPKDVMDGLKKRFSKIYTLMDFDYAGVTLSNKMRKLYNTKPMFLTNGRFRTRNYKAKDCSDLVELVGQIEADKIINALIVGNN